MIDSTVAVQTKGVGSAFQTSGQSSMAVTRSATLAKTPRRIRFPVSSPNQRSIRFSQLEPVGMKGGHKTGMALEPVPDDKVRVGAVVVHHEMEVHFLREFAIEAFQELEELLMTMAGIAVPNHFSPCELERGKKSGRGVALVVVGHRSAAPFLRG